MGAVGIASVAVYVPRAFVERSLLAAAWGVPAQPGRRSSAGADEDSITMAVEAGRNALGQGAAAAAEVGLLVLASTTMPYQEKQNAGLAATALDLRKGVRTVDVTGSLRCAIDAVALAADAVASGGVTHALVLVADRRLAAPGTADEQGFGDGGAAILLSAEGALGRIHGFGTTHSNEASRWRASGEQTVHSFEGRLDRVSGLGRELPAAVREAIEVAGLTDAGEYREAFPKPNPEVGDWGAAAPLLALVRALEGAPAGGHILWGAPGDGAAAAVVIRGDAALTGPSFEQQLKGRRELTEYGTFVAARGLVVGHSDPESPDVSPVAAWRREEQVLGHRGGLCTECGTRQYPASRACVRCGATETQELVRMATRGRVFTFTLDHLSNGTYQSIPTAKCVLDLDDGTRFFAVMTEVEPAAVRLGMPVELSFRLRGAGGGYRNYGWNCRPAIGTAS